MPDSKFVWRHQTDYFNASTYLAFLEEVLLPNYFQRGRRIFLIQDNASYHKKPEVYDWFKQHRRQIEVFLLPPYSPEFNATERVWYHTRHAATHNRFFDTPAELCGALFKTFREIQAHPSQISGLMRPFY